MEPRSPIFRKEGRDWGFGSFAFHPQFNQSGTPGFGKFYTLAETSNKAPKADFTPWNQALDHFDTVLLEWTALDPGAAVYDGGPPRELIRIQQPHKYHNGGQIAFNPLAAPEIPTSANSMSAQATVDYPALGTATR